MLSLSSLFKLTCNPGIPRTEARPGKKEANRSDEEIERRGRERRRQKEQGKRQRERSPLLGLTGCKVGFLASAVSERRVVKKHERNIGQKLWMAYQ